MTKINILTTFYTSVFDDLKNVIVVCIVMSKSSDVWYFLRNITVPPQRRPDNVTSTFSAYFAVDTCAIVLYIHAVPCVKCNIICVFWQFHLKSITVSVLLLEGHFPAKFSFNPTQNKPEPAIQGLQDYSELPDRFVGAGWSQTAGCCWPSRSKIGHP